MEIQSSSNQQRNSSIELIKVFAIFLICLSHVIPYQGSNSKMISAIDISVANTDWQYYFILLLRNCGQIGNLVFLTCSFWFLAESNKVKLNKIINMVYDSVIISVTGLIVFTVIGYELPLGYVIKQFFPITFNSYWFITCYILFYCVHPLLNQAISILERKYHFLFCTIFVLLYCFARYLVGDFGGFEFYWTLFLGFIGIYFMVAYLKKYMIKSYSTMRLGLQLLFWGFTGWICSSFTIYVLGLRISFFSNKQYRLNNISNPFIIAIGFGIFLLCCKKYFYSKLINYLSSLSMLMFLVSSNRIWMDYAKYDFYNWIMQKYSYDYLLLEILISSVIVYLISSVICVVYKCSFGKFGRDFSIRISTIFISLWEKICLKVFR